MASIGKYNMGFININNPFVFCAKDTILFERERNISSHAKSPQG